MKGGDASKANGIWLSTWLDALERARKTGGSVLRLDLSEAGLSSMQHAETRLAAKYGVPLVVVSFNGASTEMDVLQQLEAPGGYALRADLLCNARAEAEVNVCC